MCMRRRFRTLPFRFCSFFRRSEVEQELRDELHDHLERKARELLAAGSAGYVRGSRDCRAPRLAGPPPDGAMALEKKGEFVDRARGHEVHGCACKNGSTPSR